MITIQARTYEIPSVTPLAFFRDDEHFGRKVRDHFLNPAEPWCRLLGVGFLRQVGQKLRSEEVSALEEAYGRAVPVLDAGIRFAAALPLYVRYHAEAVCGDGARRRYDGFYMLAQEGFKIVAHGGTVRTAYFLAKTPRDSYHTLFNEAWRSIKARALTRQYVDSKGGRAVEHREVEWFSRETWARCPNPHRKPRASARPAKPLTPEIEYWLHRVADSVSGEG